jgi:integrase
MTGHIRKRGKRSWAVVIDLGRDPDGRRKQKWHTIRGTKNDAVRRLTEILHSLDSGLYIEPSKLTVEIYLEKWLEVVKANITGKTFERYQEIVRRHLAPALGTLPLPKLTPLHIQSHYSKALEKGRLDGSGGLSAQTVLHHHRILREALHQAVRWQLLARNPADAVDPPKPKRTEMRALSESETAWLLEVTAGTRLYVPILLAVTTGVRRGELLAVRWRDIDLDNETLAVRRSIEETRSGIKFKEPKTAKGRRLISLPALTVEILRDHRAQQQAEKDKLGGFYHENDLVLSAPDGQIWKPETFTGLYFKMTRRVGIKLRFHDLRHTHASHLLRAGVNAKIVSERLGHSTVGITLDVYSHVLPGMQVEAASRIDSVLRKAIEKQRSPLV